MEKELDPDIQNLLNDLDNKEPVQPTPKEPEIKEVKAEVVQEVKKTEIEEKKDALQLKLLKLIEGHCENAEKLITDVESDRSRCDEVYNILFAKLQDGEYSAADVTSVVSLLQTKTESSKVRALMMQEVARLLASLRNNPTIGETARNDDISPHDINKLLSGDMPSDE
jgi:hypothetical protein